MNAVPSGGLPGKSPGSSAIVTAAGATPLAMVTVILWQQYIGPLDGVTGSAVGAVGAAFFGYAWSVLTRIVDRYLEKPA